MVVLGINFNILYFVIAKICLSLTDLLRRPLTGVTDCRGRPPALNSTGNYSVADMTANGPAGRAVLLIYVLRLVFLLCFCLEPYYTLLLFLDNIYVVRCDDTNSRCLFSAPD